MESKNKKPLIFIALLFSVLLIVGGTIAYYTSSDTFENEFDTGTYKIETQEVFQSPDNWTPGTTTPKTVIATNKGNTPAAVRIKLTPSWKDANGGTLSLTDSHDNEAAIINFADNLNSKWTYSNGYYYYNYYLDTDESTSSLLNSVTFNPNVDITGTHNCETVNGVETCVTEKNGYAGGTYELKIEVETCQYDKYQEIWNVSLDINKHVNYLMVQSDYDSNVFGKDINRRDFESITTVDNKNVDANSIDSWDCSAEQNESVMCWYTDEDNNEKYELYIGQNGGVMANPNSSYAFYYFSYVDSIDLSNYNTTDVTRMDGMFRKFGHYAPSVNLDLRSFDMSNVTTIKSMFEEAGYNANSFRIDTTGWDTKNIQTMEKTFFMAGYDSSTFDLHGLNGWDTSKVTTMKTFCASCGRSANTWSVGDLTNWDTSLVRNMENMFDNAGYNATTWNSIGTLNIYASSYSQLLLSCKNAKGTINIHNYTMSYGYHEVFSGSATVEGSGIVVNYTSNVTDIDDIIATKSSNSNVVKGVQLD